MGGISIIAKVNSGVRRAALAVRSFILRQSLPLAYPGVTCARGVGFGRNTTVRAFGGGSIELGEGSFIADGAVVIAEGGVITIGPEVLIGRGAVVVATERIAIGAGTLTAEYVTIRDQDHRHDGDGPLELQGSSAAGIVIGDNVWLGAKVTVTKGVQIASRCVVGANAVVTRSLDARGVYGGVPARLLRRSAATAVELGAEGG